MSKKEYTDRFIEIEDKENGFLTIIKNQNIWRTDYDIEITEETALALVHHLTEVLNCLEKLKEKVQVKETAQVKLRKPRELPSAIRQVKESGFLEK